MRKRKHTLHDTAADLAYFSGGMLMVLMALINIGTGAMKITRGSRKWR